MLHLELEVLLQCTTFATSEDIVPIFRAVKVSLFLYQNVGVPSDHILSHESVAQLRKQKSTTTYGISVFEEKRSAWNVSLFPSLRSLYPVDGVTCRRRMTTTLLLFLQRVPAWQPFESHPAPGGSHPCHTGWVPLQTGEDCSHLPGSTPPLSIFLAITFNEKKTFHRHRNISVRGSRQCVQLKNTNTLNCAIPVVSQRGLKS